MKDIALSLVRLIYGIDYFRPTWKKLSPTPLSDICPLDGHIERIRHHDPKFIAEIKPLIDSIRFDFTGLNLHPLKLKPIPPCFLFTIFMYPLKLLVFLIPIYIFGMLIFHSYFEYINPMFNNKVLGMVFGLVYIFILLISPIYSYFIYKKNQRGKKNDSGLREHNQKVIDYAKKFFIENNIDPKQFPIKLAFNDYSGLIYEKKGKTYQANIDIN